MSHFLRKLARVCLDVLVITVCIVSVLRISRRRSVDCGWEGRRGSCAVETEDSLGRVEHDTVEGVRGAAYRNGVVVGLVTDAEHKGEHALFGTHEIQLDSAADAERVLQFAVDQEPATLSIRSGVAHPRVITTLILLGLVVYSAVTSRLRRRT
jgi:hypothetical protein